MDEEALDRELENAWRSVSCTEASASEELGDKAEQAAALTFDFPEWGLDFYRSESKRPRLRHFGSGSSSLKQHEQLQQQAAWCQGPVEGCPILTLPESIYLHILKSLGTRDLCASRQVCTRWYDLCSQDCLWERPASSEDDNLPRWISFKNCALECRVGERFPYSKRSYELLKEALNSWWDFGQPNGVYTSSKICPLIRKMTLSDWCLMYDVMTSAFNERSSQLAGWLLLQKRMSISEDIKHEEAAGAFGMQLWCSLRKLWSRYIAWVKLVSLHCADLNYAIHRSLDTPTLYNKAVVSFRSQVLLSYGLRGALQQGLRYLSSLESKGTASEQDIELLCSLHHLLQELDVADDLTLPSGSHTQVKLRRCFLGGESSRQHSRSQILAARLDVV